MTEEERWKVVEDCCLRRDHTGLLVIADAFQETGEEQMASTLRWAVREEYVPEYRRQPLGGFYWVHTEFRSGFYDNDDYDPDCKTAWLSISEKLQEMRKFFND